MHTFRINPNPHTDSPDVCSCGAMFVEGFHLNAVKVAHLEAHGVEVQAA